MHHQPIVWSDWWTPLLGHDQSLCSKFHLRVPLVSCHLHYLYQLWQLLDPYLPSWLSNLSLDNLLVLLWKISIDFHLNLTWFSFSKLDPLGHVQCGKIGLKFRTVSSNWSTFLGPDIPWSADIMILNIIWVLILQEEPFPSETLPISKKGHILALLINGSPGSGNKLSRLS